MTHFRKRFPAEVINRFNEKIIELGRADRDPDDDPPPDDDGAPSSKEGDAENSGTIPMDATCAPADIKYPTDLNLVNDARELSEAIIDKIREHLAASPPRPRTKPQVCRKRYLEIVKHPKCGMPKRWKALRFLLNVVKRNLGFIHALLVDSEDISAPLRKQIGVIQSVHDQQREMLNQRSRRVAHRIVNLQQPHVRPIVRGKAERETEFGAKLTAGMVDGYTRLERFSWDAYNEAGDLQTICERYRERTGHYPEAVLADKLFRNRENLRYCTEHGIRLSGPRLGRPPKERNPELLKQELADNSARNAIEGKFGQCKRRLGMNRVMAKRRDCSETVIAITILTANLIRWMQEPGWLLLFLVSTSVFRAEIPEKLHEYQKAA